MGYRVKGTLKLPDGSPASNAEIEFISRKNFSPLVQELKSNILCGQTGAYDVTLEFGEYAVIVYPGGTYPAALGTIILAADTAAGQDLPSLLQQSGWQPATPEYIQQITAWLAEANASATSSKASASAAKISETSAKSSEIAVEAYSSEVAANTTDVRVKHADVVAKAAQVSIDASATQVAKSTAVSAADTATQKALAAAESEASAFSSATRAEQAAQTVTGALIDAGPYNASGGILPNPSVSSGVKRSSIWKVTASGTAGGIELGVGDSLIYTASDDSYYKIDNTESVYSVNGMKGVVTLSSSDVGADNYGTAQNLVIQHAAKSGAHEISGVVGLQASLDSKYSANNKPSADDIGAMAARYSYSGDLNDLTVNGFYALSGQPASNKPDGAVGGGDYVIMQHWDAGAGYQIYTAYNSGKMWTRSKAGGKWSEWRLVYDTNNKPTAYDVGADPAGSSVSAISDHEARRGAHPISGVDGLEDELSSAQLRISALEQWPKAPKLSDIFTMAAGWSVKESEFTVIEMATHYSLQGIFRRTSGGITIGSFKRDVRITFPPAVMQSGGVIVPTYIDSISGTGPMSCPYAGEAVWVMVTILASKI